MTPVNSSETMISKQILQSNKESSRSLRFSKLGIRIKNEHVITDENITVYFWSYYNDIVRKAENDLENTYLRFGTNECWACKKHIVACPPYYSRSMQLCYHCVFHHLFNSEYELKVEKPLDETFLNSLFQDYSQFYENRLLVERDLQAHRIVTAKSLLPQDRTRQVKFHFAYCHCGAPPSTTEFVKFANARYWRCTHCGSPYMFHELQLIPGLSSDHLSALLNRPS